MAAPLETRSLRLVPHAPEHLRALVQGPEDYERLSGLAPANGLRDFIVSDDVSPEWLAALESATGADPWRFGFALVHMESGMVIGNAGFTGPPGAGSWFFPVFSPVFIKTGPRPPGPQRFFGRGGRAAAGRRPRAPPPGAECFNARLGEVRLPLCERVHPSHGWIDLAVGETGRSVLSEASASVVRVE